MGAPTVSLIMAAHEPDADYFRLAVETALEQVGVEHEVVVVDDGSSEPLAGLLDRPDHPALRLLRIEHGGESRARNVGIEQHRQPPTPDRRRRRSPAGIDPRPPRTDRGH